MYRLDQELFKKMKCPRKNSEKKMLTMVLYADYKKY